VSPQAPLVARAHPISSRSPLYCPPPCTTLCRVATAGDHHRRGSDGHYTTTSTYTEHSHLHTHVESITLYTTCTSAPHRLYSGEPPPAPWSLPIDRVAIHGHGVSPRATSTAPHLAQGTAPQVNPTPASPWPIPCSATALEPSTRRRPPFVPLRPLSLSCGIEPKRRHPSPIPLNGTGRPTCQRPTPLTPPVTHTRTTHTH
jgi:hypothetical protein